MKPNGCNETPYTSNKKALIESYIKMGCGGFIRVKYSDDQCIWNSFKKTEEVIIYKSNYRSTN